MPTLVYRNGKLVDKNLAGPRHASDPAPSVISDTMQPLKHMATGRILDSKSQFRADTRASGTIEVGTDPAALRAAPRPEPKGVRDDVQRAIAELRR